VRKLKDDQIHDLKESGGPDRNRTGVRGFAGRCITTLPPGHNAMLF
jgi:hypothetical protein